jgi:hypothetical protein
MPPDPAPSSPPPPAPRLLPWPQRLLVFAALALLALLSIRVIDRHAMLAQQQQLHPQTLPKPHP